MYADVSGTSLYYERFGSGPPLLMMHGGMGLDHTYFRPWCDALSSDFELIYFDQRGNGRSEWGAPTVSAPEIWAMDTDQLCSRLKVGRFFLFGHSYGSFVAQEYAETFGQRLLGLILCSSAPGLRHNNGLRERVTGPASALEALDRLLAGAAVDDESWRRLWLQVLPLYFHRYNEAIGAEMDKAARYRLESRVRGQEVQWRSSAERLAEITAPVLVLCGKHDWVTPPSESVRLCDVLPNATLVQFADSGHFPFVEEPDLFASVVRKWATGVLAADRR